MRPPRSAIRRSDSRISALNAAWTVPRNTVGAAEQEQRERRHARARAGDRRSIRPSREPALAAQPPLERGPSGRRRARDRSQAGAAGRAGPAPAARSRADARPRRACRRATPAAITTSPSCAAAHPAGNDSTSVAASLPRNRRFSARTRASGRARRSPRRGPGPARPREPARRARARGPPPDGHDVDASDGDGRASTVPSRPCARGRSRRRRRP